MQFKPWRVRTLESIGMHRHVVHGGQLFLEWQGDGDKPDSITDLEVNAVFYIIVTDHVEQIAHVELLDCLLHGTVL